MKLAIGVSLLLLLVLTGCVHDLSVPTQPVLCSDPYIWNGTSCCVDLNNNAVCDSDEKPADLLDNTCEKLDYKIMNICSVGSSVRYVVKVGPENIDSFTIRVEYTPSSGGKEQLKTFTITGGKANTLVKGQVTLPPGIYSKVVIISDTCDVEKNYGPDYPGILQSC